MYNWKINITTRSTTWERSMDLRDLMIEVSYVYSMVRERYDLDMSISLYLS